MTRDEAIALRGNIYTGSDAFRNSLAGADVDSYVALGMLGLDEAMDVERRAVEVLNRNLGPYTSAAKLIGALSVAGFKIVSK